MCELRKDLTTGNTQKGQGMVEYALIIAFVVVVSVALALSRPEIAREIMGVMSYAASIFEGFSF